MNVFRAPLLVAALGLIFLSPLTGQAKTFKVVIDAGHGGTDSGAMYDGYREAEITLKVAKYLEKIIEEDESLSHIMTRRTNSTVHLNTRSDLANNNKADLFVSIHVNSNPSARSRGAEFYFLTELPPDEEAMFLAERENHFHTQQGEIKKKEYASDTLAIIDDLKRRASIKKSYEFAKILKTEWERNFRMRKRPIRQAPFHVLAEVNMPSVLVELGFITNRSEARWLSQKSNQRHLAKMIYNGIKAYQERMDKLEKQGHIKAYAKR